MSVLIKSKINNLGPLKQFKFLAKQSILTTKGLRIYNLKMTNSIDHIVRYIIQMGLHGLKTVLKIYERQFGPECFLAVLISVPPKLY